MSKTFSYFLTVLFLFASPSAASAQAVPDNIPDNPEESLGDRERERFEERHHATFARFFGTGQLAIAPGLPADVAQFDFMVQGGFDTPGGDAFHLAFGSRTYPFEHDSGLRLRRSGRETAYLFAMGYDVRLTHFFPSSSFTRRSVLGISAAGISTGRIFFDTGVFTIDIGPKYILPVNQYWSLPIGLKISRAVMGDLDAGFSKTFVGASIGVKRHFGQRRTMERR